MSLSRAGFLLLSYLIGSIPTGYWMGLAWKGVDVRQQGSGNLGATNVFRVLGKTPGLLTLLIDILKGLIPVLVAQHLFPHELRMGILTGLATILGHTLSIFVRFRGGKGMATSFGVFAALLPLPSLIGITVFISVIVATRYVSLGSMLGALTLVVSSFIFAAPLPLRCTCAGVALFVVWTHRKNIQRLIHGTELRIDWSRKPS